jgi:hypothetical protein
MVPDMGKGRWNVQRATSNLDFCRFAACSCLFYRVAARIPFPNVGVLRLDGGYVCFMLPAFQPVEPRSQARMAAKIDSKGMRFRQTGKQAR